MPVSFNRYALGEFMRDQKIDLKDFNNLPEDLKTIQKLAYYGLVGGYAAKHDKELEISYMKACIDLFHDEKGLSDIMQIWAEQQPQADKEEESKADKGEGKP